MYTVKSIFDTLQGEGHRTGARSVFVRFAGCNLWTGRPQDRGIGKGACSFWCDSDFFKGEKMGAPAILDRLDELWPKYGGERWCVLTGGEPFLQVDPDLVIFLHLNGWKIAAETNGTVDVPEGIDWLTVSPKLGTDIVVKSCHELKVVLPGGSDGWAVDALVEMAERLNAQHRFVQPQDAIDPTQVEVSYLVGKSAGQRQYELAAQQCVDFVKANPSWRLSLQTHKMLGLP